jgi:hypothetical protein
MKKIVLLFCLCSALFGQAIVTKLVPIRYLNPTGLSGFMKLYGAQFQMSQDNRIVALKGTAEEVAAAERALKELDVPSPNVEVTFFILKASRESTPDSVPPELKSVIEQLKSTFVFRGFQLLETLQFRTRSGSKGSADSTLRTLDLPDAPLAQFELRCDSIKASGEKPQQFRIDDLHFSTHVPYGRPGAYQFTHSAVNVSLDAREGQKVVVGKTNIDGKDSAYFLVLTAKVIE